MGTLYYGDNLDVLKRYIADASVDLVYLDPPFNSAQNYNAFFQEKDGTAAASQIQAFKDTWEWNIESVAEYNALTEQPGRVSEIMQAFRTFLGGTDMMAYLVMMAPRLVEMRRALKEAGSLYLHCDPTASHYLKLLLDAVFAPTSFRAEITWKRTNARSTSKNWPHIHDTIFHYAKSDSYTFFPTVVTADKSKLPHTLVIWKGAKYQTFELTGPGRTLQGESGKPWHGFNPSAMGRHWANAHSTMDEWAASDLIHFPANKGFPRRRSADPFSEDERRITVGDVWTDIDRINQTAKERLGYPTQKPVALLERIITASSNPGDLVLDPFCGCGTTIDAAEKLGRQWIGIDITSLSTALIKSRLRDTYGGAIEINTVGEPRSVADAEKLAAEDKYQFQWWALGLVGARPLEEKKGADKGIDGKILFRESPKDPKPQQVIFSVKGGGTSVKDIRDLRGVIERDNAAIGVLLAMQEPTKPMRQEAAEAGFFSSTVWHKQYPRIQIYTVAELLTGRQVERPPTLALDETYKRAPKAKTKPHEQQGLGL